MNLALYYELSEYLSKFGIGELRTIGQRLGVSRPTQKSKKDLFEDIIGVLTGEIPPTIPSGRGAPIKERSFDDGVITALEAIVRKYKVYHEQEIPFEENEMSVRNNSESRVYTYADEQVHGLLELREDGGVLRQNGLISENDVCVPRSVCESAGLREGDFVVGFVDEDAKGRYLAEVISASGVMVSQLKNRKSIFALQQSYPREQVPFGRGIGLFPLDWFSPVGYGQRVLISGGRYTGKTALLSQLASEALKLKEAKVIVLLLGARPEEANEMISSLKGAECYVTGMAMDESEHVRVARLVFGRAQRLTEFGQRVILFLDSPALLASSKEGGMLLTTSYLTAGNYGENGSFTVFATACETFHCQAEERAYSILKSASNCFIYLSECLAREGVFPAYDCVSSSTLRAELLQAPDTLQSIRTLRGLLRSDRELKLLLTCAAENRDLAETLHRVKIFLNQE